MKHWFIALGFIFIIHSPIVYSHGSSHYICQSERINDDLIQRCTSYNRPAPDKIYFGYYSPEEVQKREDNQIKAEWATGGFIISMLAFGGFIISMLILTWYIFKD